MSSIKKNKHNKVRSRGEPFREFSETKIWSESPSEDNPYIADSISCHGYDLMELVRKRSFVDVFFLLFRGELPVPEEAELLESLMIALINPGPRHNATRASMNAAVGKTNPLHILPIGLSVLGGDCLGGGGIERSMRAFRKLDGETGSFFFEGFIDCWRKIQGCEESDLDEFFETEVPGFGQVYGGIDLIAEEVARCLAQLPGAGSALKWGSDFHGHARELGVGWLMTGVAAAAFSDLGFHPRAGGVLFQLLGAPGLAAHGLELSNKPFTAMPYIKDENYVIKKNA